MNYSFIPELPNGHALPFLGAQTEQQAWSNLAEKLSKWFDEEPSKEALAKKGYRVSCWTPKKKATGVNK